MNGNQRKQLTYAEKFLMAGNLATIIGVALVSTGSLLRMVQKEELPETIVFGGKIDQNKAEDKSPYSGRRSFFTD